MRRDRVVVDRIRSPILRGRGLGTYLAVAISLLSLVSTVILAEVIGVEASNQVRQNIGSGLAELALQTADKLDRGMFERYREVRLMAARTDLASHSDKRALLDALQQTYPFYAWIGMADLDGKVIAANGALLQGVDVSKRPWFKNALQDIHLGDVHDAVLLAKLLPDTGEPKRFVDVAFPYHDGDGKTAGVLGAHLSWSWAKEVEASIFTPVKNRLHVEPLIVGKDGLVLLGPATLLGKKIATASFSNASAAGGFDVETWPDGKEYLVGAARSQGYRDYPGLGWTVLVRQDVDNAFAPVRSLQRHVLAIGIGLSLLLSLLGYWIARRITRPLTTLVESAQAIQAGSAVRLTEARGSYHEVRTLAGALDALVSDLIGKQAALAELNTSLEARVADRTQALGLALDAVRRNEQRIQTIIQTAQDAYLATDLSGQVMEWNAAAQQMFGWRRKEVLGKRVAELIIPPEQRAAFAELFRGLEDADDDERIRRRIEYVVLDRDGRSFPIEVTVSLVRIGGEAFYSAFLHDISARKEVERMKNEFISTVSHELRTPLTAMRASLAMLADDLGDSLTPDAAAMTRIARTSCERLVRLVNDILDIEKIEANKMSFSPQEQELAPLLEQAVATMSDMAAAQQVRLRLDCAPGLRAKVDQDKLLQVLSNLLSNAIKFSPAASEVVLSAAPHESGVRLSVADHGPGIPAAFRHRVFEKFAQADATDTRRQGGSGLGLNICRSLVQLHGGSISFETEEGAGTTFHVDLPN